MSIGKQIVQEEVIKLPLSLLPYIDGYSPFKARSPLLTWQGFVGLLDGAVPSASQSAIEKLIYFYGYESLIQLYQGPDGGDLGMGANLVIGYVAEFFHLPITMPLDQTLTRFQALIACSTPLVTTEILYLSRLHLSSPSHNWQSQKGESAKTYLEHMGDIYKEKGLGGFYKGLTTPKRHIDLMRPKRAQTTCVGMQAQLVLCLKPAIQFTCFDQLKNIYLRRLETQGFKITALTALQAFVLGALARAVATFAVFPYTRSSISFVALLIQTSQPA